MGKIRSWVDSALEITLRWRDVDEPATRTSAPPQAEPVSWSVTHVPCVGPQGGFSVRLMNGAPPPTWQGLRYTGKQDAEGRYIYGK